MTPYFQITRDANGDVWVADGLIMQPTTGVTIRTGLGQGTAPQPLTPDRAERMPAAPASAGLTLLGGSGHNVILSTEVSGIPRVLRPFRYGHIAQDFTLRRVEDEVLFVLSKSEHILAQRAMDSGIAGNYAGTTAGHTQFNLRLAPSAITVTPESYTPPPLPKVIVHTSGSHAQGGLYATDGGYEWTSEDSSDWTITVDPEGRAELRFLDNIVAIRPGGPDDSSCGPYDSTSYTI